MDTVLMSKTLAGLGLPEGDALTDLVKALASPQTTDTALAEKLKAFPAETWKSIDEARHGVLGSATARPGGMRQRRIRAIDLLPILSTLKNLDYSNVVVVTLKPEEVESL